ncbi:hypothetical protein TgHK011_009892 [Trichoderma gracile]|nr:hypothetical protein TgHK011_009892 [Trichoderma gracile]
MTLVQMSPPWHASSHMLALAHEMCIRVHNGAGRGWEQMRHAAALAGKASRPACGWLCLGRTKPMPVSACLLGHTDVKTTIPDGSYRIEGDIGEGSVVSARQMSFAANDQLGRATNRKVKCGREMMASIIRLPYGA